MASAAWIAGMADTADPHADPAKDVELGNRFTHQSNASRASLPNVHNRSQSAATQDASPYAAQQADQTIPQKDETHNIDSFGQAEGQGTGEIEWGPLHPCYPHLNPYVPLTSPLYESTRIVRVRRDWMVAGDLAPAFSLVYPEILEPTVTEDAFRALVTRINKELIAAFDPRNLSNWTDAILGLATGWIWDDLGFTALARKLTALDKYIGEWNRTIGAKTGTSVVPLRRTGYMSLDLQVPTPELGPDVPPTPSLALSRANSVRTTTTDWTSTSVSRSQAGRQVETSRPEVPAIPSHYLGGTKV